MFPMYRDTIDLIREFLYHFIHVSLHICITVSFHHSDAVFIFHSIPVSVKLLVQYFPVCCPASAVGHARLLGAHCRRSYAQVPRQCEPNMSENTVSHQEESRVLETLWPRRPRLYIRVSQEFFQTMATPNFFAFGYLNMKFIEKN